MTTKEAFLQLISQRAIHQKLGVESSHIRNYRNMIKENDKYPSMEKMMELLEKGGWKAVQEIKWQLF